MRGKFSGYKKNGLSAVSCVFTGLISKPSPRRYFNVAKAGAAGGGQGMQEAAHLSRLPRDLCAEDH